jgi:phage terminase large subunit-like protein
MVVAQRRTGAELKGVPVPRVAPPQPAKSKLAEFEAIAKEAGKPLLPWQSLSARYLTATGPEGWVFREVAIVVARQNGKTELLVPRILMDLRNGKRILHTAQNRTLPRQVFMRVAWQLDRKEVTYIRYANGQEEILMVDGGSYRIVAPQRGARGLSADTLIFDELREFEDYDIIGAATPTLTASTDPQTIYLSNAGSDARRNRGVRLPGMVSGGRAQHRRPRRLG